MKDKEREKKGHSVTETVFKLVFINNNEKKERDMNVYR